MRKYSGNMVYKYVKKTSMPNGLLEDAGRFTNINRFRFDPLFLITQVRVKERLQGLLIPRARIFGF